MWHRERSHTGFEYMLGMVKNAVMVVHLPIARGRTYTDMGYVQLKLRKNTCSD